MHSGNGTLKGDRRRSRSFQCNHRLKRINSLSRSTLPARESSATSMPIKPPQSTDSRHRKDDESSTFRAMFLRGDLPVHLDHSGPPGERPKSLKWLEKPNEMQPVTLAQLLSKFALGLSALDQPFRFVAECAISDLLTAVENPETVRSAIFPLVRGIRAALCTCDTDKHKTVLCLLSRLSAMGSCGPALVPFYRHLLPPLRKIGHSGLQVDVSYERGKSLTEMVENTLNDLERTGGANAYINIKYIIPTYDSYFCNY